MVEMDDLKKTWAEYDRKLDTNIRLTRQLLRATTLNRVRSPMRRLAFFLGMESIIQFAVVVALGSFIYEHIDTMRFALPAAALDVGAIALLSSTIRQLTLALQIDYDKPIPLIQKQLEHLRVLGIRCIQGIFLVATLAWTPLLIVTLKGLLGLDAYRLFGVRYLVANLLVGLAIIPLAIWLSMKLGRFPMIQRLMKDLGGYNLSAATGFLATLSEFEDEKPD
jgi:hypothetical protein